jgi:hypothetical protein
MEDGGSRGTTTTLVNVRPQSFALSPVATLVAKTKISSLPVLAAGLDLTPLPTTDLFVLTFSRIPAHPDDPLCRSLPSKFWTTLVAALLVMIVSLVPRYTHNPHALTAIVDVQSATASSCSSGAASYIHADLGGNASFQRSDFFSPVDAG